MKPLKLKYQTGVALIMFVLMLMGIGGFVLVGYGQGLLEAVEVKKYKHNTRVLKEAKAALLQYAYNYPQFNSEGPGRLPCPAPNSTGLTGALTLALCQSVGRLPWAESEMSFYDARDADGEQLWYAVSENFYNLGGGPIINSGTDGSITLVDQSQNIIYDGNGAGIAAIIIAPGPEMAGQDRNAGPDDPVNFLDSFNGFDNAVFNNDESDTNDDGFILGPVFDQGQKNIVVNDQMIVITAAEVNEMAEKATLQAYRDVINDYLSNTNVYPWLDNYSTTDLTVFDADINTIKGRVPSIFGDYFAANTPVTRPIISDLRLSFEVAGGVTLNYQIPASVAPDIFFDAAGDLSTSFASAYSFTRYYWEGHLTQLPTLPVDGIWEICPFVTGTEDDCNQDTSGNFIGGTDSDVWLQVKRLTVTFDSLGSNPFRFPFNDLQPFTVAPPNPGYTAATVGEQAYIRAEYNNISNYLTVNYDYDADFQDSFDIQSSGGLDKLFVELIYYPELPDWALTNDWHSSIQMAVAQDYQPGGGGDCTVLGCLVVNNLAGINNNKVSLLAIAGEHDDGVDDGAANFEDDLHALFEPENDTSNITYDKRAGNDKILVLREQ